jgi:hypothetical protein
MVIARMLIRGGLLTLVLTAGMATAKAICRIMRSPSPPDAEPQRNAIRASKQPICLEIEAPVQSPATRRSNRVSTNTNLRPRETRFCAAETKAPKGSLKSNRQFAETKCAHESPPVRAYSQ